MTIAKRAPYVQDLRHSLFLLQLAHKVQLQRVRTVRHEFETIATSAGFVASSGDAHKVAAVVSELHGACTIVERQLASLLLVEADLLRTMKVLRDFAERAWDLSTEPKSRQPRTPRSIAARLRAAHPVRLAEAIILIGHLKPGPPGVPIDQPLQLARWLASARFLHESRVLRLLDEGTSPPTDPHANQDDKRPFSGVSAVRWLAAWAHKARVSLDDVLNDADTRTRDDRARRLAQLARVIDDAKAGVPPTQVLVGRVLYELGGLEETFEAAAEVLSSARRTMYRLLDGLSHGFPPVPRALRSDRSFTYRLLLSTMNAGAAAVRSLHSQLWTDDKAGRAWFSETMAYTDVISTVVRLSDDALAIECPLHHVDAPRFLVDIFHECAHGLLPDVDDFDRLKLPPTVRAAYDVFEHRLKLSLPGHRSQQPREFRGLVAEVIADTLAVATSGPFYSLSLLLTALSRTVWSPRHGGGMPDYLVRASAVLTGACLSWGLVERDDDPTSDPKDERILPWKWSNDQHNDPLCHLFQAVTGLYRAHVAELKWTATATLRSGEPHLRQAPAREALESTRMAEPMVLFVRDLLDALRAPAGPNHADVWQFGVVERHQEPAEEHWRAAAQTLTSHFQEFVRVYVLDAIRERHGDQVADDVSRNGDLPTARLTVAATRVRTADDKATPTQQAAHAWPKRGDSALFVELNAFHLVWQLWFNAQSRNFEAHRYDLVGFERFADLPAFLYLALMARNLTDRDKPPGVAARGRSVTLYERWDEGYFGVGRSFETVGVDAHWSTDDGTSSVAELLQAWFEPYGGPHDATYTERGQSQPNLHTQFAHGLGHVDLVYLRPTSNLSDLGFDEQQPAASAYVQDPSPSYLRTQGFELLTREDIPGLFDSPADLLKPSGTDPFAQPCFLFLQHLRPMEPGSAKPSSNVGFLGRAVTHLRTQGTVKVIGVARAFAWAEMAVWLEATSAPGLALRSLLVLDESTLAQFEEGIPQTDTTTLLRWNPLLAALARHVGIPLRSVHLVPGRAPHARRSAVKVLRDALVKLVALSQDLVGTAGGREGKEVVVFSFRGWLSRKDPRKVRKRLRDAPKQITTLNAVLARLWNGNTPDTVILKHGFGNVDVVGRIELRDPPHAFAHAPAVPVPEPLRATLRQHYADLGEPPATLPGWVLAQAITALAYLTTTRWLMETLGTYEIVTQVNLPLSAAPLSPPRKRTAKASGRPGVGPASR